MSGGGAAHGMLPRQGNRDWKERLEVLRRLVSVISKKRIAALLVDREFVGKEWLKALIDMGMPFVVRTRENICIANTKGIMLPASLMFRGVKVGKYVAIPSTRKIMSCQLYVVATRLPNLNSGSVAKSRDCTSAFISHLIALCDKKE